MLEELPVYVKLKNAYNPAHYPANKKISAEEWNALWMSVMYQGNHQEDILASILNITLPENVAAINAVETKAIQALSNSEEAHEMSSQALDIANEANQTANEALSDINLKQNIIDEELNTSDKTIVGAINEVKNSSVAVSDIINNLNSIEINKPLSANMGNTLREMIQRQEFGRSYNTVEDLVDALNIEEPETFKVPFLFLIVDLDVPDFWVAEVMETSVPYEYTTDAALIAAVKTSPLQVGYYKISISETTKVDLTNYYNKTETNDLLDEKADIDRIQNVVNPTIYGGISYGGGAGESGVSFTDLNSLLYSGFYTCYGTTANVPSSLTSWFIEHINSNVGTTTATQFAYAYNDNKVIYKRTKTSGTWGSWEKINLPNRIQNADNTSYFEAGGSVKNIVTSTSGTYTWSTKVHQGSALYELVQNAIDTDLSKDNYQNRIYFPAQNNLGIEISRYRIPNENSTNASQEATLEFNSMGGISVFTSGNYYYFINPDDIDAFRNENKVAKISDVKGKSVANYEIETTDWVADSTYLDLDFNYKATITISGVLSTEKPEVAYSPADSVSGNFSNFPNSVVDGIEIWCKETPTSTIIIPLARTVIV